MDSRHEEGASHSSWRTATRMTRVGRLAMSTLHGTAHPALARHVGQGPLPLEPGAHAGNERIMSPGPWPPWETIDTHSAERDATDGPGAPSSQPLGGTRLLTPPPGVSSHLPQNPMHSAAMLLRAVLRRLQFSCSGSARFLSTPQVVSLLVLAERVLLLASSAQSHPPSRS